MEYEFFENTNLLTNWTLLLEYGRDKVQEIENEWNKIDEKNKIIQSKLEAQKLTELKEIKELLTKYNIRTNQSNGKHLSWFETNIASYFKVKYRPIIPTTRKQEDIIHGLPITITYQTTLLQLYDAIKKEYDNQLSIRTRNRLMIVKCIEYATENRIDITEITDIPGYINNIAMRKWFEENYPEGTCITHKLCDYCDTYYMGEHRCSCGNVRINVYAEGNLLDGFYQCEERY